MSDRDKIGVSYAEAHTLYLDLNFDVLYGCQWKCEGCFVDKTAQTGFLQQDYQNLTVLLETAIRKNYQPFIATVGPTDLFSSSNTASVLADWRTIDLLKRFEKISFASAFLAETPSTTDVIDVFNEHYSDKPIEINITFDLRQIHNTSYLEHVKATRHQILKRFRQPPTSHALFNVFDYSQTRISELLHDYVYLHNLIEQMYNTDIDFNFSIGRKTNLSREEFERAAQQIKVLFNDNVDPETVQFVRFSVGRLTDSLVEKQYNFRNGELYYSPMFYERYVSFDPHYRIPLAQWSIEEIEKFEDNLLLNEYRKSNEKECGTCQYLGSCADRGILHMMDRYQIKDCILAKRAMNVANNIKN